MVSPIILGG